MSSLKNDIPVTLTPEQKQLAIDVRNEWINLTLHSGKDLTVSDIKDDVNWLYSLVDYPPPQIIVADRISDVFSLKRFRHALLSASRSDINTLQIYIHNAVFQTEHGESAYYIIPYSTSEISNLIYFPVHTRTTAFLFTPEMYNRVYVGSKLISTCLACQAGILACIDFVLRIGLYINENIARYIEFQKKGVYGLYVLPKVCIITKVPLKTIFDDRGRLHSVREAAIQFRDAGYYFIHGVAFNQSLFEKVTKRELTPKQLVAIQNVDQRFVALNHYGFEKALDELKPTLINTSKRGNKLYKVRFGHHTLKFLKYTDTVNGTPRISFVKPSFVRADEAMAWKHNMTLEEYLSLKVEG